MTQPHAALRARIAAAGDRLIARSLAEQYADPFWYARYGEKADRRGTEDGKFHLQYLDQALAANDTAVLTNYAKWLQPMLTSRGMCTRHIVEHFDRLRRGLAAENWPDGLAAVAMLDAVGAALHYPEGSPARELQDRSVALVAAAVPVVSAAHPALAGRVVEDLTTLVSYLADAAALGGPQTYVAHVTWLSASGFLDAAYVDALVRALPSPT